MDTHVYAGPYVKLTPKVQVESVKMYGCANPTCKAYTRRIVVSSAYNIAGAEFCSSCGHKTGESEGTRKFRPHVGEVTKDCLWGITEKGGIQYAGPNFAEPPRPRNFNFSGADYGEIVELGKWKTDSECEWMSNYLAVHGLAPILAQSYDFVEIGWGFIVLDM